MHFKLIPIILVATVLLINLGETLKLQSVSSVGETEWRNESCPMLPWPAVTHAIKEANAQTTVFFLNETAGMPMEFLTEANIELGGPMTKISLFDCQLFAPGSTLGIVHDAYFEDIKNKCMRMSCTFLVTCNSAITKIIAQTMIEFNLFRPWTLWVSSDDTILHQLLNKNIGATGVPIALPSIGQAVNESDCPNAIVVYSQSNNRIQRIAEFTSDRPSESRKQLFLAGTAGDVRTYRILDLLNDTINVAIKVLPPYLDFDFVLSGNSTVIRYKGLCIKVLETFAEIMNFSYNLVPFSQIGSKTVSGKAIKWNGLIGALMNNEIDLALGALTITEDRAEVVDFTNHFLEDSSSILSHKPRTLSRVLIFFEVFPWQVWILLLISAFVVGPILAVQENIVKKISFIRCLDNLDIWTKWWTVGISIMQKGDITVQSTAARLLTVFWLFFLIILIGTYTGLLLAHVSFPGTKPAIESLEQLTSIDSPFPLALHPSATESYVKEGSTVVTEAIAQRWMRSPGAVFPVTPSMALDCLADDSYALLSERLTFQYMIAQELDRSQSCPFHQADSSFLKHYYSFMVPKNSALLGSFNVILHRLMQSGIIDKWLEETLPDTNQCDKTVGPSDHRPMSLTDMQGAFYILAIGQAVSMFSLIIERGFGNGQRKVFQLKRVK